MPSRATSTRGKVPDWRTWFLFDYARYWYAVFVIALVVFGVGELARRWQPFAPWTVVGLLLLAVAILFGGAAGYLVLWRRETRAAMWLRRRFTSVRAFLARLGPRAEAADPPVTEPDAPADPENRRGDHDDNRPVA